jgi:hypothetical protein
MHFLEDEDKRHEAFANCPESLEGRLLFAVPKSKPPNQLRSIGLIRAQKADCYKQRLIYSMAQT